MLKRRYAKNKIRRFNRQYVTDNFGRKLSVTFWNVFTSLNFWIISLVPMLVTLILLFVVKDPRIYDFTKMFLKFILCWGLFFLIWVPSETIINSRRIERVYHRRKTYDVNKLQLRKRWLKNYYTKKFGHHLHSSKVYYVQTDNNIPVDHIIKSYRHLKSYKIKR